MVAMMPKNEIFDYVLNRYDSPVLVLEIGRIRDIRPQYEEGDGWSTLQFARHPMVNHFYSVDNDPKTKELCQSFIADSDKVTYSDSVGSLELPMLPLIDFLYLDAENDAEATVRHYEEAKEYLMGDAVIPIDDVYSPDGRKGELIIPLLEAKGYEIEMLWPMALARRVAE